MTLWLHYQKLQWNFIMFKFSAVSQIWKKYIQKLNDWDLPLNSGNVWNTGWIQLLVSVEIVQSGQRTDFDSSGWFRGSWFNPDIRHYFSSGESNACLLACVITTEDPQSEWLKCDESNMIYWLDKDFNL